MPLADLVTHIEVHPSKSPQASSTDRVAIRENGSDYRSALAKSLGEVSERSDSVPGNGDEPDSEIAISPQHDDEPTTTSDTVSRQGGVRGSALNLDAQSTTDDAGPAADNVLIDFAPSIPPASGYTRDSIVELAQLDSAIATATPVVALEIVDSNGETRLKPPANLRISLAGHPLDNDSKQGGPGAAVGRSFVPVGDDESPSPPPNFLQTKTVDAIAQISLDASLAQEPGVVPETPSLQHLPDFLVETIEISSIDDDETRLEPPIIADLANSADRQTHVSAETASQQGSQLIDVNPIDLESPDDLPRIPDDDQFPESHAYVHFKNRNEPSSGQSSSDDATAPNAIWDGVFDSPENSPSISEPETVDDAIPKTNSSHHAGSPDTSVEANLPVEPNVDKSIRVNSARTATASPPLRQETLSSAASKDPVAPPVTISDNVTKSAKSNSIPTGEDASVGTSEKSNVPGEPHSDESIQARSSKTGIAPSFVNTEASIASTDSTGADAEGKPADGTEPVKHAEPIHVANPVRVDPAHDSTTLDSPGTTAELPLDPAAPESTNRWIHLMKSSLESGRPMRVRLSPPELGTLQIEVAIRGGMVTARIDVQTTAARQIILDSLSSLQETFVQIGSNVDHIEVHLEDFSADERSTESFSNRDEQPEHQTAGDGRQNTEDHENSDDEESTAPQTTHARGVERLDVQI